MSSYNLCTLRPTYSRFSHQNAWNMLQRCKSSGAWCRNAVFVNKGYGYKRRNRSSCLSADLDFCLKHTNCVMQLCVVWTSPDSLELYCCWPVRAPAFSGQTWAEILALFVKVCVSWIVRLVHFVALRWHVSTSCVMTEEKHKAVSLVFLLAPKL